MVIRELTYQLHKLEALESALVSADHHDKKSVLGIGGKNPDRSIPRNNPSQELCCLNMRKLFGVLVISGKLSQCLCFSETCRDMMVWTAFFGQTSHVIDSRERTPSKMTTLSILSSNSTDLAVSCHGTMWALWRECWSVARQICLTGWCQNDQAVLPPV